MYLVLARTQTKHKGKQCQVKKKCQERETNQEEYFPSIRKTNLDSVK